MPLNKRKKLLRALLFRVQVEGVLNPEYNSNYSLFTIFLENVLLNKVTALS